MISIISPVYNGEEYISRYLDSLLNLDYADIQLIIVNDGSTDKTKEIVEKYEESLNKKFKEFLFINKDNGGAASCLNHALKYAKGEFLMWPDTDDELVNNCIKKYLEVFEKNPEIDAVIGKGKMVNFHTREIIGYLCIKNKNIKERNYFKDLILERDVYFAPTTMVKLESFRKANGGNEIFISHGGQNWQMLLPLAKYCNLFYLDEVTYIYNVRENSHSRSGDLFKTEKRIQLHEEILRNTINKIDMSEKEKLKYLKLVKDKYNKRKLKLYFKLQDFEKFKNEYRGSNIFIKIKYLPIFMFFRTAYKIYKKKRQIENG